MPFKTGLTITALILALALLLRWVGQLSDVDPQSRISGPMPGLVKLVAGRSPFRDPPIYFETSLKRATDRLKEDPHDRVAFQQAAIYCAALDRFDEGIAWLDRMESIRLRLELARSGKDEQYYGFLSDYSEAAGEIWYRRWLREGADRGKLWQVRRARDLIAKANADSPGKANEDYRLKVIDWVLELRPVASGGDARLPTFVDFSPGKDDPHLAAEKIQSLISRDAIWENVDMLNALALALDVQRGREALTWLVRRRCVELIRHGGTSLVPGAPKGATLECWVAGPTRPPSAVAPLESLYKQFRQEAESWQSSRITTLTASLRRGEYNTSEGGWPEYKGTPPPASLVEAAIGVEFGDRVVAVMSRASDPGPFVETLAKSGLLVGLTALLLRAWLRRTSLPSQHKHETGSAAGTPPQFP